jgi:hypothetical protein
MRGIRRAGVRFLAGLFALAWLIPGFAIPDLLVTWDPTWPVMLEAGWGLLFGVLVAAPFAVLAFFPESTPTVLHLSTVCLAVALAAALSLSWQAAALDAVLAAQIAAVAIVASLPPWHGLGPRRLSWALLAVAALGTAPWITYAFDMFAADREVLPDRDVTLGVDHYAIQGALALAMISLIYLAALWPGRLWASTCGVALCATYLGIVSLAHQGTPGGFSTPWSLAAVFWGAAACLTNLWVVRSK